MQLDDVRKNKNFWAEPTHFIMYVPCPTGLNHVGAVGYHRPLIGLLCHSWQQTINGSQGLHHQRAG
jgi:hypothetical protein